MKRNLKFILFAFLLILLSWLFSIYLQKNYTPQKQVIFSENAPKPIGPYSQAIRAGNFVFISGQIALNKSGMLDTSSVSNETRQIMFNIKEILNSSGLNFDNIVKTTIYLTNINSFKEVNEIYGLFFSKSNYPARETVEVKSLPKGAKIEISMIAME